MEKLEELQKLCDHKCEGYRNNMCYVYALSMRNITPDLRKIRQKVEEFNARFQPALSKDEMVGCSRRKVVSIAHRNSIYRYEHSGIISKSDLPVGKQGEDKNSPDSIKNKCKPQAEL